jgi:hypothetical protein
MQVSRRIEEFYCADGVVARERLTGRILLGGDVIFWGPDCGIASELFCAIDAHVD